MFFDLDPQRQEAQDILGGPFAQNSNIVALCIELKGFSCLE